MEGLISARANPIHAHCMQENSVRLHSFPLRVKIIGSFRRSKFLTMRNSKSFAASNASVQPLEASKEGHLGNTLPSKEVLEVWHNADAVCFDVDSTVCLDEGIDELAEFCGAGKAVAEWTARAMNGSVPFEEALAARLSLFNPSLAQVHDFLQKRPPRYE